jgi:carbon storage regulator CsrA
MRQAKCSAWNRKNGILFRKGLNAMLVLARKTNQTIVIDGGIKIHVLQIKGSQQVRIGIEAPQDIRVLRGELKPFGLATDGDEVEQSENEQETAKRGSIPGRGLVASIWPNKARAVSA